MSPTTPARRPSPRVLVAALAALGVLVLVGTLVAVLVTGSDDAPDGSDGEAAGSATTSVTRADYLEAPDGVTLTDPGSVLALGETATVAWQPNVDVVGVVEVRVEGVQPASVDAFDGWLVGGTAAQAAPYFVTVTLTNVGEGDLGRQSVPLYLERQDGVLVPAARFGAEFPACASVPLPSPFEPDDTTTTCQVYLSEGAQELEALTFLPFDGFEAIRWDPRLPVATPTTDPTGTPTETPTGTPSGTPTEAPSVTATGTPGTP
ncbi:hypothetical protein RDV89_19315 [Nocardioides zeae]|uniref:DUF4352 domain-containing protein n=1 Tax=Nocardioides imazamoxiresistens TaxID=3231893 RepID=A0ABU3Q1C3_9ACTN|nr:hypothetical protein [Nocardioides zeae]MDT9595246.1 hypothetical protein [Nocardioides zeae]